MKIPSVVTGMMLAFAFSTTLSQSLKLGLGGGPAFVQHSPGGMYTDDVATGGLGFGKSYSLGGKAVLSFAESPFSLVGRVSYLSMSGGGYLDGIAIYRGDPGRVETNLHLLSVGAGSEWTMLRGPVAPYVGAQVFLAAFNRLSYKVTNTLGTNEYISGRNLKVGVGLDVGAQLSLAPSVNLDIGGNYSYYAATSDYHLPGFPTLGVSAEVLLAIF